MKLAFAIIDYLIYDDLDDYDYDDLPFKVNDSMSEDDIHKKLEDYIKEHKIKKIYAETLDYNLEYGSEDILLIFSYDDKFYGFTYRYSEWEGIDYSACEEVKEYEPYKVTETKYRLKK